MASFITTVRVLGLGTTEVRGQILACCGRGGCPLHYTVLSSIPGLYLLDVGSSPLDVTKVSPHVTQCPLFTLVENYSVFVSFYRCNKLPPASWLKATRTYPLMALWVRCLSRVAPFSAQSLTGMKSKCQLGLQFSLEIWRKDLFQADSGCWRNSAPPHAFHVALRPPGQQQVSSPSCALNLGFLFLSPAGESSLLLRAHVVTLGPPDNPK